MHKVTQKLLQIMQQKKTNLAVSADLRTAQQILHLAKTVADDICVLKLHVDIIEDFSTDFINELKALSKEKQFLLFEDRKFADIGNTVKLQFSKGIYKIADWADIINAHAIAGEGCIKGLQQGISKEVGLLLIAEMSTKDHLFTKEYIAKVVELAVKNQDFVMGFIAQSEVTDGNFLNLTPGVKLHSDNDNLSQKYVSDRKSVV